MQTHWLAAVVIGHALIAALGAEFTPAPQAFRQEIAWKYGEKDGLPAGPIQLIDLSVRGKTRCIAARRWFEFRDGRWTSLAELESQSPGEFAFPDSDGRTRRVQIPWDGVRQLVRVGRTNYLATRGEVYAVIEDRLEPLTWSGRSRVNQIALSPEGSLFVASDAGLYQRRDQGWEPVHIIDPVGRAWAVQGVLGVTIDSAGQLWAATKAGAICLSADGWKFFEGKDGLPWNDFTGAAAGPNGAVWFGTHLGAVLFDGKEWHYRQGPRWLPNDDVSEVAIDADGKAWFGTPTGIGSIERRPMTLAEKAEFYESEIEQFIQRTPFGYVAEAQLRRPGDKSSADPQDSDNDGLWTAMYGAGECFAQAATPNPSSQARAKKAFEALRFLQKVTQGGMHSPPKGYIARTIRPRTWPDPNAGQKEHDENARQRDKLWKVYEPRWPLSEDGQWYWKSDTSSDELDGHYFFYGLYYDFCASTPEEKERVREVVRDVTDHLLTHSWVLIDHDGRPTRWAVYGPQFLNQDPTWWPERGLNSLSLLSYLAVAAYVTGDGKYESASRSLIDANGYAHNAMYPKVQLGPGSGNQSDDEMAFMCYYSLLRHSRDGKLKSMIRYSFFRYWANEAAEMNPFFNFAYAAHSLDAHATNAWGSFPLKPWPGWHENAMATLLGFPLDRFNWPARNSHRLDIVRLARVRSSDLDAPDPQPRGHRVNGKVLPVENRHFGHWNTDPWQLDYSGSANELAAGTVYLLPYYMGVYHGFIERPNR